jgi:four helix bundle protein
MTKDEGRRPVAYRNDEAFWLGNEATAVREEPEAKPVYDLEERTARFGESVMDFSKTIPRGPETNRIISQLVGAGTSVGGNDVEACDSVSKTEFLKYIATCKKAAREARHTSRATRYPPCSR